MKNAGGELRLVDPDDRTSWPVAVTDWVAEWGARLAGTTELTPDLSNTLYEEEDGFRGLFVGTKLVAYHCTRLLDHELELVREGGLRPLSRDLVEERIAAALAGGWITDAEADELVRSNTFALGDERFRENQVCLIAGRQIFDDDANGGVHGCLPLLSTWGGEGIYMRWVDTQMEARLSALGRPTVVVAAIDLTAGFNVHPTFCSLGKLFVGLELGLELRWADVFYRAPVAPADVLAVWQPGNPEYDRHPLLPRS